MLDLIWKCENLNLVSLVQWILCGVEYHHYEERRRKLDIGYFDMNEFSVWEFHAEMFCFWNDSAIMWIRFFFFFIVGAFVDLICEFNIIFQTIYRGKQGTNKQFHQLPRWLTAECAARKLETICFFFSLNLADFRVCKVHFSHILLIAYKWKGKTLEIMRQNSKW